jgi:hypothetical protein
MVPKVFLIRWIYIFDPLDNFERKWPAASIACMVEEKKGK